MKRSILVTAQCLVAAAMLLGTWSCSKDLKKIAIPNQRPTVRLTSAPIDTTGRYFYSILVNWVGHDPDGRVDHFLYAVDPPTAANTDTAWVRTTGNESRLTFSATRPDPLDPNNRAIDPHVFVIKAVDNDGEAGPSVFRAFFSYTVAPTVQIESPSPSTLLTPILTPSVRFSWTGKDDDGVFTIKPVRYRYRLFSESDDFPLNYATSDPDSLRRQYAPAFAESLGWRHAAAESTEVQFTSLNPNQTYLFAVVAFDEAGAYSPVFGRGSNLLLFRVGFAGTLGPKFTFFNEFFNYTYSSGGYFTDASREIELEIPEGISVPMNWIAEAPQGATIRSYRWAVDIQDLADETPRSDEETDTSHWSTPSALTTNITVGPFFLEAGTNVTDHRLYVEAEDTNGLKSLGIVRFRVVRATFENELLIVDDSRLRGDSRSTGTACGVGAPIGPWPTAAELDTFLYARGGVPWACYTGTPSPQGLFAGYAYDTIGTRTGRRILTFPLETLVKYKRVIWIVEGLSGTYTRDGTDGLQPKPALRYMTEANRVNSVGTYVRQGGLLWLLGGGVGQASTGFWDDGRNNTLSPVYSSTTSQSELLPGRFMYDIARWQSGFRAGGRLVRPDIIRYTGRFGDSAAVSGRTANASPYLGLPAILQLKDRTDADDQPPPGRRSNEFYGVSYYAEALTEANFIRENVAAPAGTQSMTISQVYASGGEAGALYNRDFVELRNRGNNIVDLSGWSLQYATGGNAWQTVPLSGTVLPGRHYLVGLAQGATGSSLPTPDASGAIDLSPAGGKIAIRKNASAMVLVCPVASDTTADVFGYGDTDCSEGRVFGVLNAANAAYRRSRGCEDTGGNANDFYAATPSPRNSAQSGRSCFEESVIDTLFRVTSASLPSPTTNPHNVGMTYYHGPNHAPVLFSGFDLWNYRRRQAIQVVDYVLGTMWGLTRSPLPPATAARTGAVRNQAASGAPAVQKPGVTGRSKPTRLAPSSGAATTSRPSKPKWPWTR